jgi:hypothetical protein
VKPAKDRCIADLMKDKALIQKAMGDAIYDALRRHKLLGQPIVVWRDGKVVWIPPEEIELPDERIEPA